MVHFVGSLSMSVCLRLSRSIFPVMDEGIKFKLILNSKVYGSFKVRKIRASKSAPSKNTANFVRYFGPRKLLSYRFTLKA